MRASNVASGYPALTRFHAASGHSHDRAVSMDANPPPSSAPAYGDARVEPKRHGTSPPHAVAHVRRTQAAGNVRALTRRAEPYPRTQGIPTASASPLPHGCATPGAKEYAAGTWGGRRSGRHGSLDRLPSRRFLPSSRSVAATDSRTGSAMRPRGSEGFGSRRARNPHT